MSEFDIFQQGTPGAMRTENDVKLLLCYIVNSAHAPVSKKCLNEIITINSLANYFEVNAALEELCSCGLLNQSKIGSEDYYTIPKATRTACMNLKRHLSLAVREKLDSQIKEKITHERRSKENNINIQSYEDGYKISFEVGQGSDKVLDLSLYVQSYDMAQVLRDGFLRDPAGLCEIIINQLTSR